jgi:hypothetical protein
MSSTCCSTINPTCLSPRPSFCSIFLFPPRLSSQCSVPILLTYIEQLIFLFSHCRSRAVACLVSFNEISGSLYQAPRKVGYLELYLHVSKAVSKRVSDSEVRVVHSRGHKLTVIQRNASRFFGSVYLFSICLNSLSSCYLLEAKCAVYLIKYILIAALQFLSQQLYNII